jgi:chromosome segregation ATPase
MTDIAPFSYLSFNPTWYVLLFGLTAIFYVKYVVKPLQNKLQLVENQMKALTQALEVSQLKSDLATLQGKVEMINQNVIDVAKSLQEVQTAHEQAIEDLRTSVVGDVSEEVEEEEEESDSEEDEYIDAFFKATEQKLDTRYLEFLAIIINGDEEEGMLKEFLGKKWFGTVKNKGWVKVPETEWYAEVPEDIDEMRNRIRTIFPKSYDAETIESVVSHLW